MEPDGLTLGDALARHLAENGFPPDGGLSERWAVVRLGPIPVCFPNIRSRRRAIPYHDLNHVLSGYGHDDLGEAEVGAWELGSGCKVYLVAWILNWSALPLGWRSPRRLFDAFVRGRRTRNLYGADLEKIKSLPIDAVRADLGLDRHYTGTTGDAALLLGLFLLAPVVGAIPFLASVLTSPLWLAEGAHRNTRS
jgi:hypothetical protein